MPMATVKMRLVQLGDEIVSVLTPDQNATVQLVMDISAEFPEGASDGVKYAVLESACSLGLKPAHWE